MFFSVLNYLFYFVDLSFLKAFKYQEVNFIVDLVDYLQDTFYDDLKTINIPFEFELLFIRKLIYTETINFNLLSK